MSFRDSDGNLYLFKSSVRGLATFRYYPPILGPDTYLTRDVILPCVDVRSKVESGEWVRI